MTNYCNSSHCQVINFDLSTFPSHVDEDRGHAYRPLIIQDALCKTGAVIFLENHQRLTKRATLAKLLNVYQFGLVDGVLAWPAGSKQTAVSAFTHPKMFDYFHIEPDDYINYNFLQMVEMDHLIIINTVKVHQHVMLPWVKCALTIDCILPIGAQSTGCRYDKKPLYRYSGCHHYDISALNIVLGLNYRFNKSRYMFHNTKPLFVTISLDRAINELIILERNSTTAASITLAVSESSSFINNIITSS